MAGRQTTSLRGLRTFCAAARHESFLLAGKELFITSSAVSHQVKSLEEELGKALFERSGRELKLTQTGGALYEAVGPLIEQIDEITAAFRRGEARKTIRVSVQPFFASEYFVPRLSEFTARNPDIEIRLGTSDETPDRHPPDADLSIRLHRAPPDTGDAHFLFPLRLVPAGSAGFKESLEVEGVQIVSDFPIIVHDTWPDAWRDWSANSGIRLPDEAKVTRLDSMIAIVRAAERGLGAALVPVPLADQWFRQGTIVRLFDEELVAGPGYYLVCRADRSRDAAVVRLRDWILGSFSDPG